MGWCRISHSDRGCWEHLWESLLFFAVANGDTSTSKVILIEASYSRKRMFRVIIQSKRSLGRRRYGRRWAEERKVEQVSIGRCDRSFLCGSSSIPRAVNHAF